MYKVWYTVISYDYGNYSGRCGVFDSLEEAITKFNELYEVRQNNETYEVVVSWELLNNV